MKIILAALMFGSLIVGMALAQTSATEHLGTVVSDDTSVTAGNSTAQVSSGTSADAAANTNITKDGRAEGAVNDSQSGAAIDAGAAHKSLTSSGSVFGTQSSASAVRGQADGAGASSNGALGAAKNSKGVSMDSASASGAHLNGLGRSVGLDHSSQGTFGARRTNLGSSSAGSGLGTRSSGPQFNGTTGIAARAKK